ncbi:hypothetical protein FSP39_008315 [Pinctada imbricata]|uniref:Uncharacterized protein n=1 Tax=Pinctada imbricata TaxID=66713 RepID=A0AA88Y7R3_PINIB|nr:hypothetical protein FSP39_008315 [Pinctada imbricata]
MTHGTDHRLTNTQSFLCFGASGVISRTIVAPADVLRTLTQVGVSHSKKGLSELASFLLKMEGVKGFFKGNFTGCLKLIPYSVTQYLVYKRIRWTICDDLGRLSILGTATAGTGAGMTATIVTYPIDMIKTRLILQPLHPHTPSYKGLASAVTKIYKMEGLFAMYRGLCPTLVACVPFAFTSFLTYEVLDRVWLKRHDNTKISPNEVLIQGTVATTVSYIITFPFDVIRRMMQARSPKLPKNGGVDLQFQTARQCGKALLLRYGVKGLWRGLFPALLKVIPYHSIQYLTYECCKRGFLYQNGYILSPFQELDPLIDQNLEVDELQEIQDYDITGHIEHLESSRTDYEQ